MNHVIPYYSLLTSKHPVCAINMYEKHHLSDDFYLCFDFSKSFLEFVI